MYPAKPRRLRTLAVEMVLAGMPHSHVAALFGLSHTTIARWAREAGLTPPRKKRSE